MLLALLLPDPVDAECPQEFKVRARAALRAPLPQPKGNDDLALRQALLRFVADFANWDAAAEPVYLEAGRALVQAAHGDEPPLVVDPFAGGGSIPLEALRLGCDAFASDLNPVACLILKVLLEDIPRYGPALAEGLRRAGAEIKAAADKALAEFYPPDPDGARPIAYLWARTARCEAPGCGAEIPLARSFWLSKKASRRRALRYTVTRQTGRAPGVVFEVFEPTSEADVPRGTVARAKAACPACSIVLGPQRVRAQLLAQRSGADVTFDDRGHRIGGARLLAVVTLQDDTRGRRYRVATEADYHVVWRARHALEARTQDPLPGGLSAIPDEPTPTGGGSGAGRAFSVQKYGMLRWGDLFTARQKLALITLTAAIRSASCEVGVKEVLGLVADRVASRGSSLCQWRYQADQEKVEHSFPRQALPMLWDFAESVLISDSTGSWADGVDVVAGCIGETGWARVRGQAVQADACTSPLVDDAAGLWFTDPPYYDAVPYADLSDFFFVWLKRALPRHPVLADPFDAENALTPKDREAVQDETRSLNGQPKDRRFFESTMARAFVEGRRVLGDEGVGCVVFAHKTTQGWEALLSGMIQGGWVITASWPIVTEMGTRLRARDSAALSASVHLVCRPRDRDAPVGDWGDVLAALPRRVTEWMDRLGDEGIRGADLVFACIGPALELFSRYPRVELPDGQVVGLGEDLEAHGEPARRGYLSYVWEAVGRAALARVLAADSTGGGNGGAGILEEDARLTALFLWTVQSTTLAETGDDAAGDDDDEPDGAEGADDGGTPAKKKGLALIYDVVRRFAQPLGIHLDQWEGRIVETEKGLVRLLPVSERASQLFGAEGAAAVAERIEASANVPRDSAQGTLFPELATPPSSRPMRGRRRGRAAVGGDGGAETRRDATTLDRVHAAMLFQASGASNALRALLEAEIGRGPEFLRLANALTALYPKDSEEKRLLDAMLLAVPR
jgi:adenine-specific DNA methylase